MSFEEFSQLVSSGDAPSGLPAALQALLCDARGDWQAAHEAAQDDSSRAGAWVHAYLHRKEGDLGNARYWYGQAGRDIPNGSLEAEWEQIARELATSHSPR